MSRIWPAILLLLLFVACDGDEVMGPSEPDIEYLHYGRPENVIENLRLALQGRDLDELRERILYPARAEDAEITAAPFTFYFDTLLTGAEIALPESIGRDCFLATLARMRIGGEDGQGNPVPAIASLEIVLSPESYWDIEEEEHVEGDPVPPRTEVSDFATEITITLVEPDAHDVRVFSVRDRARIHLVPQRIDEAWEYSIWKWRDIGLRSPIGPDEGEDATLSGILAFYFACP